MKILEYSRIEKFVSILEKLLVLGGVFFTSVFLFKNLANQDIVEKEVALFYNVPMIFHLFIWLKNKIK